MEPIKVHDSIAGWIEAWRYTHPILLTEVILINSDLVMRGSYYVTDEFGKMYWQQVAGPNVMMFEYH